MSNECSCLEPITIATCLCANLVKIIQNYLHSNIKEEFYQQHYQNFNLYIRLDKQQDIIEDIKISPNNEDSSLLPIKTKDFIVLIEENEISTFSDVNKWFFTQFTSGEDIYLWTVCLTAMATAININGTSCTKTTTTYSYENMHIKLLHYFGDGNMNVLLTEMEQQDIPMPDKQDFERIWYVLNNKVTTWMSKIDFWTEIHS